MSLRTLLFIPTYNELQNAPAICSEIHRLGLDADILFIDDGSPDGTGEALERCKAEFPRLTVQHRAGKHGIGSAHRDAINWAYDQGYELLVSLDCDFTHSPADIPLIITLANHADVAVGSRWLTKNSLPGWNIFRRGMTLIGHLLTKYLLRLPYDATGAFRAYRLDHIPRDTFSLIKSQGYAFFFESLFILKTNGVSIAEISIALPARTYGSSKMTTQAAWCSLQAIFNLSLENLRHPERFQRKAGNVTVNPALFDPQDWNAYWEQKEAPSTIAYELVAAVYRKTFIQRRLNHWIRRTFAPGAKLLHAGCGSGQVDRDVQGEVRITAVDISVAALDLYQCNNPRAAEVRHASIFALPFAAESFDGYYNMGVLEHFTHDEIRQILAEALRVLRRGGKIIVFWPHFHAPSVYVLRFWHWLLQIKGSTRRLHPPEVSLLKSQQKTLSLFEEAGFRVRHYEYGPDDIWIQAVIVAEK